MNKEHDLLPPEQGVVAPPEEVRPPDGLRGLPLRYADPGSETFERDYSLDCTIGAEVPPKRLR